MSQRPFQGQSNGKQAAIFTRQRVEFESDR
jgi:hypothetical protein